MFLRSFIVCLFTGLAACSLYDESQLEPVSPVAHAADAGGQPAAPQPAAPMQPQPPAAIAQASTVDACASPVEGEQDCERLARLPAPAQIDGMLECGLRRLEIKPGSWNGAAPVPAVRAEYAAAWRDDGLYVFVQVYSQQLQAHAPDQPIFCGDAVEIFVDGNPARADDAGTYASSGTMQFVVAAPVAGSDNVDAWRFVQGNSQGAWIARALTVRATADGYAVEATISAADLGLWQWSPHSALGFNLAIDVSSPGRDPAQPCSQRLGQLFLHAAPGDGACRGEPWCDVRAFCRPALQD